MTNHSRPTRSEGVRSVKMPERPREVQIALGLLVASLATGVLRAFSVRAIPAPGLPAWFAPVVLATTFCIIALLILGIAFGRFWVVIIFAVGFALGLPGGLMVLETHGFGSSAFLLFSLQACAQGAALVLLFRPAGRAWFRAVRAARAASELA